ncbi:MAG: mannose-1-phosphate guanylyltransferase/mannose-6-phosphate isomerase [Gammaproteobacteria bacterium]|nr:mannose-1-phosphate guanylyltransferase/mannose-6-phosphate isomerase [Gammaproteobacteria bacterium]
MRVIPVILCGGAGTRLWPLSRELYPKQLLALVDDYSLLQNTVSRCAGHPDVTAPMLVCNEEHRFLVAEQLREIEVEASRIILEPEGRNTAPAVALAAHEAMKADDDAILVVLPSDHVIQETALFLESLTTAIDLAKDDALVTFGVVPDKPETGYGYIKKGAATGAAFKVDKFVEKPDVTTASEFLQSGLYCWNSGMFVFKASAYLKELAAQTPKIAKAMAKATADVSADLDFTRVDAEAFKSSPSDSIDYAVMEHTADALVVPLDAGWSDIGSWDALWQISEKDEHNNTLVGDAVVHGVEGSLVWSESRLVSVVGLNDVIVVETADAVMVASQDQAQDVKSIVNQLKGSDRIERTFHQKVYRPWGYYEGLDAGPAFQVKRLGVNPGASLSLQLHHHRAEHWVVVNGIATVTVGEKVFDLNPNESCYIPIETQHRLQNLTEEPLEIIEVQSGSYLGEDDIVRFEDNYGR